jgi:hypothetical protein
MALHAVPGAGALIITMEYTPAGKPGSWCIMHDNACLAWLVDDTGEAEAVPVIVGSMPARHPSGPQWAAYDRTGSTCFVPNVMRGSARELFDYVAKNDGERQIYAKFADDDLAANFANWANANPTLALDNPPQ